MTTNDPLSGRNRSGTDEFGPSRDMGNVIPQQSTISVDSSEEEDTARDMDSNRQQLLGSGELGDKTRNMFNMESAEEFEQF